MNLKIIKGYPECLTEEQVLEEAYDIALENKFYVDRKIYDDHIIGNDDYRKYFLVDEKEKIHGLTVIEFPQIRDITICYIGLVFVHPSAHGKGWSKSLMTTALEDNKIEADVITLRTQNPRMFASFVNTFGNDKLYFPNPDYKTPDEVIELMKDLPCAGNVDENLIVRNAYPNEFVHQVSNSTFAGEICSLLGSTDAVVPAIVMNPKKVLQKSLVRR